MNKVRKEFKCDLAVIGSGMAGMAAALFAANRGISIAVVGKTRALGFASGLLDLMAVCPASEQKTWSNPWKAIEYMSGEMPDHPYSRIEKINIRKSIDEFISSLAEVGSVYRHCEDKNLSMPTSLGTTKPSYGIPAGMWNGVEALREGLSCLVIDFHGFKGFSSRQFSETLKARWPALRSERILFPGIASGAYPEHLARELDSPECREQLARAVAPFVKNARCIGFPAILGFFSANEAAADLEKKIGLPVFEIPGLPPSVPGMRLQMALEKLLRKKNVQTYFSQKVVEASMDGNNEFLMDVGSGEESITLRSKALILATGRFFGKGLYADRKSIHETLFDLPLKQPEKRIHWHKKEMFHADGHRINQAGVETDNCFRPVDWSGKPVYQNLFAAGTILAHQDWMRMKCGAGLSIATAHAAVEAYQGLS